MSRDAMTDRELLELAAKAAEMHLTLAGYIKNGNEGNPVYSHPDYKWNPLADDGDALRLAVKLQMSLDTGFGESLAISLGGKDCVEQHAGNPLAATRRAIVRAAAEIGRTMQ